MTPGERDAAVAGLRGWNDEVQAGHGRLVLVSGEAGEPGRHGGLSS